MRITSSTHAFSSVVALRADWAKPDEIWLKRSGKWRCVDVGVFCWYEEDPH